MPGQELNLLSLDGGGIRGLSSLQILKQLMERIRVENNLDTPPKPCDYFDMIGGTSTGGLIAIMLGRLRMTVDECINAYASLSDRVFRKVHHRVKMGRSEIQAQFDSSELERAIKEIVINNGFQEDELLKDTQALTCKVFVCATNKRTAEIVHLTSYQRTRGGEDRLRAVKIWEAARATSAASSFFDPISINMGTYKEDFLDGATGANNPVNELWNEAKDAWEFEPLEQNLNCLISIGTGVPSVEPFRTSFLEIGQTLVRKATETEQTAESFQRTHSELDENDRYFRFNVRNGLEHIGLEDSSQRNAIMTLTERYVQSQDVFKLMKRGGKCLANRELNHQPSADLLAKISTYDHVKVHRRLSRRRLEGTGKWFLEHVKFRVWFDGSDYCSLWCTGIVGSGKSMIATRVVDALLEKSLGQAVAYFYCESAPRNILRASGLFESMIKQCLMYLVAAQQTCSESILKQIREYYKYGGPDPDFEDVSEIFSGLFKYKCLKKAIYIIDGLDELDYEEITRVLSVFRRLFRQGTNQKLFVTSRHEPHYNIDFINNIPNTLHIPLQLNNSGDIQNYIETTIEEKLMCDRKITEDSSLVQEISCRLLSGAKGMFLWVRLQIEALWDGCFTDNDIRRALDNLPKDLDSTYRRCLERIKNADDIDHALKVFKWVGCASRPLHIAELQEAIAFNLTDHKWESGRIQTPKVLIGRCANLVVLDADDEQVRFAHPSVHQFLFKSGDPKHAFQIEYKNGQLECAELGINYLNFSDFGLQLQTLGHKPANIAALILVSTSGTLGKLMRKATRLRPRRAVNSLPAHLRTFTSSRDMSRYKFLSYAEENWANDSKFITQESPMWSSFRSLAIQPNASRKIHPWHFDGTSYQSHFHGLLEWAVKQRHMPLLELLFHSSFKHQYNVREFCDNPLIEDGLPALHLAARLGYDDIAELLLRVSRINSLDYAGRTALHYAAEKGHTRVAEMLLKAKGARINDSAKSAPETPLLLSSRNGHVAILRLLLKAGARFNVRDATRRTPLSWAAANGHEAVVQLLLEQNDNDINLTDDSGQTPLHWGANNEVETVAKLLLQQNDIEINAVNSSNETPLDRAIICGREAMVKLLLKRDDIHLNAKDAVGETSLSRAVRFGNENILMLLLKRRDLDVNTRDDDGYTPLSLAIQRGLETMVVLFLERDDIEINAWDNHGRTILYWAIIYRNETILTALLERDDIGTGTALYWAIKRGNEMTMKLLLQRDDIEINAWDEEGQIPLSWAILSSNETAMKLLLEQDDIDINARDKEGETPLSWAILSRNETAMKLLLERDDIEINNGFEESLKVLIIYGNDTMVKLLLQRDDIEINARDNEGRTVLFFAIEKGNDILFNLLLERDDLKINIRDSEGRTALFWTIRCKKETMMKLLLQRDDVEINSRDNEGRTALSWTARCEKETMMMLLPQRYDAEINSRDNEGRTAFSWTARCKRETMMKLLLQRDDVEINSRDNEGRKVLSHETNYGNKAMMKMLLERDDIEINARDKYGRTALSYVMENVTLSRTLSEGDGFYWEFISKNRNENENENGTKYENHNEVMVKLLEHAGAIV